MRPTRWRHPAHPGPRGGRAAGAAGISLARSGSRSPRAPDRRHVRAPQPTSPSPTKTPSTSPFVLTLQGATVTGQLSLNGVELNGKDGDGDALVAHRLQVAGDAVFVGMQVAPIQKWLSREQGPRTVAIPGVDSKRPHARWGNGVGSRAASYNPKGASRQGPVWGKRAPHPPHYANYGPEGPGFVKVAPGLGQDSPPFILSRDLL